MQGRLQRMGHGEVAGTGVAGDIGITRAIHSDAIAYISTAAAEVGAVDEGITARVELGYKYGKGTFHLALERIVRREIGGVSIAYDIGVAGAVYRDTVALVVVVAAQIGGVGQHGIDDKWPGGIVSTNRNANTVRAEHNVATGDGYFAISLFLIDEWPWLNKLATWQSEY